MTCFTYRCATRATIGMAVACVMAFIPFGRSYGQQAITPLSPQQSQASNKVIFPPAAVRNKHYGTVTLILRLGIDGSVHDVKIEKSSGYADLDTAAASQARRWRYPPPRRNGVPYEGYVRVPVNFGQPAPQVDDKGWQLSCSKSGEASQHSHVLQPGCMVDDNFSDAEHGKRIHDNLPPSWQSVPADNTDFSRLYIDDATAMRIDNAIHVWAMETMHQPKVVNGKLYLTRIQEMSFDCAEHTILPMVSWYYDADGSPGPATGYETTFTPSSDLGRHMQALCSI